MPAPGLPAGSWGWNQLLWNVPAPRSPSDPEGNSGRVYSKLIPVQSCSGSQGDMEGRRVEKRTRPQGGSTICDVSFGI